MSRLFLRAGALGLLLLQAACLSTVELQEAAENRVQEESFRVGPDRKFYSFLQTQVPSNGMIDVLFIIDDSGSMTEEQAKFQNGLSGFLGELRDSGFNYRVGITTTDPNDSTAVIDPPVSGYLYGDSGNPSGTPFFTKGDYASSAAEDAAFQAAVATLGIKGHGDESGLRVMKYVFEHDDYNFFREDAFRAVVIISDENECGTGSSSNPTPSRLDALDEITNPISGGSTVQMPYGSAHPIVAIRGTSYTSYCSWANSHPTAVKTALAAVHDLTKFRLYALVKDPATYNYYYSDAVELFGGSKDPYVAGVGGGDVGDIDGNQAYYEEFLEKVGENIVALTESFALSGTAPTDLPTEAEDIQVYMNGDLVDVSNYSIVSGSPLQLSLDSAFAQSTAGADFVVRWAVEDQVVSRFGLSRTPKWDTLEIEINTLSSPLEDWSLDDTTGELVYGGSPALSLGDQIEVRYFEDL